MLAFWKKSYDQPAAAKLLQSCLTLCNPIDGSPPGSSVPGILQARILEWVAISFSDDQPRQHKKQRHYFANKGPSSQRYGFSSSLMWMWELDYKESWEPKNWCFRTVMLEKTLKRVLGLQGDPTSPSYRKSVLNIYWKDWCWSWNSNIWPPYVKSWLLEKTLMLGKMKVGGEGDNRGWDGWMASLTWWTWVWISSRNWW